MDVVTTEGKAVGKVTSVLSYPAQDMLEIGETLIPVVKEFIERIDLDAKTITVKPIKGMIEPLEGE
jgi:16S rRNA processing protein RimM